LKTKIIQFLKFSIPLGLGVFLIWLSFRKLTPNDFEAIRLSFKNANYFWIIVSIILAILSHVSRAWRWKYTLEPLGYYPHFLNSFMAVMIGYLVNLGVPRMGEVSRAAAITKYENIPFNKAFGTIIAERVADSILLLTLIFAVIVIQISKLKELILTFLEGINIYKLIFGAFAILLIVYLFLKFIQRSKIKFFIKIREFISGLIEGVKSILHMKDSKKFIFHTFLIWGLYFLMFYLAMFAIPEIQHIPLGGVLTAFVIGGISIAVTNGGIGAYPLGVALILGMYGVPELQGLAFGWIVWTAQTLMIIVLGGLSFIFMPIYNKRLNAGRNSI
jgi:uncharacterized protein (TIRG00374 family)